jgi:hypothetical protein
MNISDPNRAIYCDSVFGGSIVKECVKWLRGNIRVVDNGNVNTDNASFLGRCL